MRRNDREVTNFTEIVDILERCNTIRLGLNAEPYPYVVPLSYGYEAKDGQLTLYFHGAKEGFKHGLLAKDNRVCVETDLFYSYKETPGSATTEYESFIGFGTAEPIEGEVAVHGMALLLAHCGFADLVYDPGALNFTRVYKVTLESFSAKRRFI